MWDVMRSLPCAALSCAVYMTGSLGFAPRFPFAVVDMYAHMEGHREGAVPVFLVGGKIADVHGVERIQGIPDLAFSEAGIPCSMGYAVDEIHYYVTENTAPDDAPAGPLEVAFGWRWFRLSETGVIEEPIHVIATGTAYPVTR